MASMLNTKQEISLYIPINKTMKKSDWKKMKKRQRIKALVDNFGMSKKEAIEIYTPKIKDLPGEIKSYFN